MSLSLVNKKFNVEQNKYLLNCDVINKYSLKSLYKKPTIKKINIHFPLTSFSNTGTIDSNSQLKSMMIFYTFFSIISYINFKKVKIKKFSKGISEANFSLKVTLSDTESIYLFLFNLIVENHNRIEKNDIKLFKKSMPLNLNESTYQHSVLLPADFFLDIDDFFSKSIKDIDLKAFGLSINFVIKNFNRCQHKEKLMKNISFLWLDK